MADEMVGGSLKNIQLAPAWQSSWEAAAKSSVKVEPDAAAEADVEHLRAFWTEFDDRKIELEQTRRDLKWAIVNKRRKQMAAEFARYADTKQCVATRLAKGREEHERDEANPVYATRRVELQHWMGPKLREEREYHQMMKAKIDEAYRVRKKQCKDEYKEEVKKLREVQYTPREAAKKVRGSFLTKDQRKRRTARVKAARQAERARKCNKKAPAPSDRVTRSMGSADHKLH